MASILVLCVCVRVLRKESVFLSPRYYAGGKIIILRRIKTWEIISVTNDTILLVISGLCCNPLHGCGRQKAPVSAHKEDSCMNTHSHLGKQLTRPNPCFDNNDTVFIMILSSGWLATPLPRPRLSQTGCGAFPHSRVREQGEERSCVGIRPAHLENIRGRAFHGSSVLLLHCCITTNWDYLENPAVLNAVETQNKEPLWWLIARQWELLVNIWLQQSIIEGGNE